METLLSKAKSLKFKTKTKIKVTDEHIELAMAWLNNEVSFKQISHALGKTENTGNVLYTMSIIIREGYKEGKLSIKQRFNK